MPPGIYAISESHLTARGKARFKQELFFAKSAFKFTGGHDAPYKKDNLRAVGGKDTGVGFLSTFPSRPSNGAGIMNCIPQDASMQLRSRCEK